jgi:radical SAM protein with 4Fe4S-binding SPASM domain
MNCPYVPDLSYNGFSERLRSKIGSQRFPLNGSIELNFRCNLRCRHCYVAYGHTGLPGQQELSTQEIQRIFDEVTAEGCLWMLLTGGEPLMRKDFKEIYLYARRKGLLVTLFTNGTMITPEIADFLAEYRPFNLEITLYGYTQETYERITGIPGSHRRCFEGIERLLERQVILGLKTMVMTLNQHEFSAIRDYAKSLGVPFRFDGMINSALDGCGQPLNVRLEAGPLIQIESQQPEYKNAWLGFLDRNRGIERDPRYLYSCGAGIRSFHIDPYGQLSLCLMAREHSYDLRSGTFREGWNQFLLNERSQMVEKPTACGQCELRNLCTWCPGWSYIEHGANSFPVEYLCQVAQQRQQALAL